MDHFKRINAVRRTALSALLILMVCPLAFGEAPEAARISMAMRDADLSEVMQMLSRQNRLNILLAEDVQAEVSFNLYDVGLHEAVNSIANAAGFVADYRDGTYFILPEEKAGKAPGSGFTIVRAFPLQYADAAELADKLSEYISSVGTLSAIPKRRVIVVEDQPAFVNRIASLLATLDARPRQIMIEARILEVKLSDEESYGIDWTTFFDDRRGRFGTQGLSEPGTAGNTGFFFDILKQDYEIALRALETDGRVRNLAAPRLVTVENQEAEVIIGDRRGYAVTTTINQVTTESIEFLESGTILRVTPSVDENGYIRLEIHPEVSNGTVDENGIPSQTTTEVTTNLVVSSGETIFIGGLLRSGTTQSRQGVPILGKIPGIRWLFSNRSQTGVNTETVVMITPRLVDADFAEFSASQDAVVDEVARELSIRTEIIEQEVEDVFGVPQPTTRTIIEPASEKDPSPPLSTPMEPAADTVTAVADSDISGTSNPDLSTPKDEGEPDSETTVPLEIDETTDVQVMAVEYTTPLRGLPAQPLSQPNQPDDAPDNLPISTALATSETDDSDPDPSGTDPDGVRVSGTDTKLETLADDSNSTGNTSAPQGLYAINLHSAPEPMDREAIFPIAAAPGHKLYETETAVDGNAWYRLRLGFFDSEVAAAEALDKLRADYPEAWVVRVAQREHAIAENNAIDLTPSLVSDATPFKQ